MLTKEQIRVLIDLLECASDVQQAIEDAAGAEWSTGEAQAFNVVLTTREENLHVASVRNLPPEVLAAGLRAMEAALMELADVRGVA
jgi:hypothetical protein